MRRILLVDDEPAITFAMAEYFEAHGYRVDCAADVAEARSLLAGTRYAVAMADLRLGVDGPDGLALIGEINQLYPEMRTILLTAYGSPEVEQQAKRIGVDAFLHKPQPLATVARLVDRLCDRPGQEADD